MKKVIALLLALAVSASLLLSVSADELPPITLSVNGTNVECDVPPQIIEDRTLVPLRAAFESLGAAIILWDESTSTVHAQSDDGSAIALQIGSKKLFKENKVSEMDVPARIIDGRTMVPIRAIAECLGCTVEWVGETRTVKITK